MVRARCPFCNDMNDVGLTVQSQPSEPTLMMRVCDHFVFSGSTRYLGADYVGEEFSIEFSKVLGSYGFERDLMRILNDYFKFVGPVAFAPSKKAREDARKAVEEFLSARNLLPQ